MKKKKNKESKKNVIIAIAIIALIALLAGGTFSWWTWRSANNTAVSVTVKGMTMTLDGGGNISTKNLVPTTCSNTTYAIQRTITYKVSNSTNIAATATIQLDPTTFPSALKNANLKWKLTTSANCGGTEEASGTFSSTTQGTKMNLKSYTVAANTAATATGNTKTLYLSIWLDTGYTYQNIGDSVGDPMQDKSMTLKLAGTIAQNQS